MKPCKVLVDTCVVIDALENREPFCDDARELFIGQVNREYEAYISANAVTDIHYLIRQHKGSSEEARDAIRKLSTIFYIADTCGSDCRRALTLEGKDYEDNVLIATAIRTEMDYIITRNTKDFEKSPIPVKLPGAFLSLLDDNKSGK